MVFQRRFAGFSMRGAAAGLVSHGASKPINLVADDLPERLPPPKFIGIQWPPEALAWSVARLEQVLRRFEATPEDSQFQLEARRARYCISRFWLQSPIDQLETLYLGEIGRVHRLLLYGCLPDMPLSNDEGAWQQDLRNGLLRVGSGAERLMLLLALMPYCKRGHLKVENEAEAVPEWLMHDYTSRCVEGSAPLEPRWPMGRINQAVGDRAAPSQPAATAATPPAISTTTGAEGFRILQMPQAMHRIQELIRGYGADSRHAQVCRELGIVRSLLAQIWLDAKPSQLEPLVRTTMIGPIHRALVASNFGAQALTEADANHRRALEAMVRQPDHQAWLQALLALMPYCPVGAIPLDNHGDRLPAWFWQSLASDQPRSCSSAA